MRNKPEFPADLFGRDTSDDPAESQGSAPVSIDSLIFVGFNSRVVALDRDTGNLAWDWHSPKGTGFVAVLLDGDRLIVSVQGYTYCLDPSTGACQWSNPLSGMGVGIPCLASSQSSTLAWSNLAQNADDIQRNQRQQHNQTMQQQNQIVQQHLHQPPT